MVKTGQHMVLDLRRRLFDALQFLPLRHHVATSTSDAVFRVEIDALSRQSRHEGHLSAGDRSADADRDVRHPAEAGCDGGAAVAGDRAIAVRLPPLLHQQPVRSRRAGAAARVERLRPSLRDLFGHQAGEELRPGTLRAGAVHRRGHDGHGCTHQADVAGIAVQRRGGERHDRRHRTRADRRRGQGDERRADDRKSARDRRRICRPSTDRSPRSRTPPARCSSRSRVRDGYGAFSP